MYQIIRARAKELSQDSTWIYIVKLISAYFLWKILHYFLSTPTSSIHTYWRGIVHLVGGFYARVVAIFLRLLGEDITQSGIGFQFHPSLKIVYVEEHCLAFPAMIIFSAAIVLYEGNWKDKLWFVPMGLFAIVLINILRLIFIGLSFEHFSDFYFSINHSLIYVVITYALIFLMITWWIKRENGSKENGI